MKKSVIFLFVVVIITALGCKKDKASDNNNQTIYPRGFTLNFNGKEYKGIDSGNVQTGFTQHKGFSLNNYNNIVSAILISDVNFRVDITNVPDSGIIKALCESACDPVNGDAVISYRDGDGNVLTGFSGTVEGVSSGEIKINASKKGNILAGTLKWK